jgi:hypothetical protein
MAGRVVPRWYAIALLVGLLVAALVAVSTAHATGGAPTGWAYDGSNTVASPAFVWPAEVDGYDTGADRTGGVVSVSAGDGGYDPWCYEGSSTDPHDAWFVDRVVGDPLLPAEHATVGDFQDAVSIDLSGSGLADGDHFTCAMAFFNDENEDYVLPSSLSSGQVAFMTFTYGTASEACTDTSGGGSPCAGSGGGSGISGGWLGGWLAAIVADFDCLLTKMAAYVAEGLVSFANIAIAGAGAALAGVLSALPNMPGFPTLGQLQWLNWALPVSSLVALVGTLVTLVMALMAWRVVLKWVKAL